MVNSILVPSISYDESKYIEEVDNGYDGTSFELELFPGLDNIIVLGNVNYRYIDKNVLYFPVYLTSDGDVKEQIGVYEILASNYANMIDEDGDLNIEELDNPLPLYYSFFTEKYLKESQGILKPIKSVEDDVGELLEYEDKDIKEDDDEGDDDEEDDDEEGKNEKDGEKEDDEMKERIEYVMQEGDVWIKRYMKNAGYSLLNNEGGGDCLFAVIRDAFKEKRKEYTVPYLRQIVSNAANEVTLENFKELYDMYSSEITNLTKQKDTLVKSINQIKDTFDLEKSRDIKVELKNEGKALTKKLQDVKIDLRYAIRNIDEYKWMKGINTLDKFKRKILTKDFWADSWAINILEKTLKIKIIILSQEKYDSGDIYNVLQCGDFVDEDIEHSGEFIPINYILTSYSGDHYQLIKYNGKRVFTFANLPLSIKGTVVDKCMEKQGGIYNYIPDFIKLKLKKQSAIKSDSGLEDIDNPQKEKFDEGKDKERLVNYDSDVVLQFYSKSQDKPVGKGAGEKILPVKIKEYLELEKIPDWRKVLSNFYAPESKLNIDNKSWLTVEHYYHSQKFIKNNPQFSDLFSLDSRSEISKSASMAKAAGGKTGKYRGAQIRDKGIKIDDDFFIKNRNEKAMYKAQLSKYKQDEHSKKVLLATNDAKLQHFVRGSEPIVFYDTMIVREQIKKDKKA